MPWGENGVYLLRDLPLRLSHGCDLFVLGVCDEGKKASIPENIQRVRGVGPQSLAVRARYAYLATKEREY